MISNIQYTTIGEIADVKGGKRLKKGKVVQDEIADHPYIRVVDFREDGLDSSNVKYITEDAYRDVARYTINPDEIYISIAGTIGRVGIIPPSFSGANLTENAAKITAINRAFDKRFVMYYLRSEFGQAEISSKIVGTSQPKLALFRIKEIRIPQFSTPHQQKIAAILSAYDDLIENNLRRIKILEEMAQTIYREWFVKFRFPGHQKVKMVDSSLGKIPEGWEVKRLGAVCSILMGQSPKSEFYNTNGEGLPFHQGVTDFGERFPKTRVYCTFPGRIAEVGDILFSVRAPVGRLNLADRKIIIGRGLSAIRNLDGYQYFTFHQLKEIFKEEDIMGGGTIFKAVTKGDMERIEFLYPRKEHLALFEKICSPMAEQLAALGKKNRILRQTRDLLLPKLISGELDVSELDIKIPETERN
jgi:type I restriction enzyme S subunit